MRMHLPAALLLCLLLLNGCGQKGPLYLPKQEQPPLTSDEPEPEEH